MRCNTNIERKSEFLRAGNTTDAYGSGNLKIPSVTETSNLDGQSLFLLFALVGNFPSIFQRYFLGGERKMENVSKTPQHNNSVAS